MKLVGKLLCKLGLHEWEMISTGSVYNPLGDKCKRCKMVRQFCGWGYIYGWDANDLPPHIPPPTDDDTIL